VLVHSKGGKQVKNENYLQIIEKSMPILAGQSERITSKITNNKGSKKHASAYGKYN
jgi:hypothetical protein